MKACCREYLSKQFPGDDGVVEELYAEYRSSLERMLGEIDQALGTGA